MRSYEFGTALTFETTFRDAQSGMAVTPSAVVLRLKHMLTGVEVDVTPTGLGTGVFQAEWQPTMTGVWTQRWQATGSVAAADESDFEVRSTDF